MREGEYATTQIIPGTPYQVIRVLGAGGTATVYEVEDITVGKRYVLKTLHAELRMRHELAVRLMKEARTLARLSHANIVEVVTAGETADEMALPFFVMQKLDGHTLRSILRAKGRLPLATAYGIAIDLLDALDHAHAHGVIHRDVKPENIFIHRNVNGTYVTKLLDFGLMRMMSAKRGPTGHRFVGTLRYAPPEQLLGEPVTARTDLYAAGLVLYEMIAGRGPFDDEPSDRDIGMAHLHREPPALSTHVVVPRALDQLVTSALSKRPEDRPADAFTFAARLRAIASELHETLTKDGQPTPRRPPLVSTEPPPTVRTAAPRVPSRWPTYAAIAGIGVMTLAAAGVGAAWSRRHAATTPTAATSHANDLDAFGTPTATTYAATATPPPFATGPAMSGSSPTDSTTATNGAPQPSPNASASAPARTPSASSAHAVTQAGTQPATPSSTGTGAGASQGGRTGTRTSTWSPKAPPSPPPAPAASTRKLPGPGF